MGFRSTVVGLLVSMAFVGNSALAQERTASSLFTPLTASEYERLVTRVDADERVRALVGSTPRTIVSDPITDKNEAIRYATDPNAPTPTRHLTVTFLDRQSNRAARAQVDADGTILHVEQIAASDVPFVSEDAAMAFAIVRTSEMARHAIPTLDRFRVQTPGTTLSPNDSVVQFLPLRSSNPRDPCARDRCADLIFSTPAGYLALRAHVDLTRGTVSIEGASR